MSKPTAIDMRMHWGEAAKIIASALIEGHVDGKLAAREELMRMARAADLAVAQEKLIGQMQARIKALEQQRNAAEGYLRHLVMIFNGGALGDHRGAYAQPDINEVNALRDAVAIIDARLQVRL